MLPAGNRLFDRRDPGFGAGGQPLAAHRAAAPVHAASVRVPADRFVSQSPFVICASFPHNLRIVCASSANCYLLSVTCLLIVFADYLCSVLQAAFPSMARPGTCVDVP